MEKFTMTKTSKFEDYLLSKSHTRESLKDNPQLLADLSNEYNELRKKYLEDLIEAKANQEDIDAAVKANKEAVEEQLAALKVSLHEQGKALKTILDEGRQMVKDGAPIAEIKANKEALIKMAKGIATVEEIVIKTLVQRSAITNNQQAMDLPEIGQLATRQLSLYEIFRKRPMGTNDNGTVRYYDWDADTTVRAAAAIAEGAAFPESTAKWAKYSADLKKIGDTIPVTEEFFEDEMMFYNELDRFLTLNVDLIIDNQLCNGDGTSNTLSGLLNQSPAYTATASGITDASIYDLVVKMKEAITKPYGAKYRPDFAAMNLTTINKYKLKKDANKNYVMPPFVSENGKVIDGITVIEVNAMPDNQLVIGDRRYADIYEKQGVILSKGYVGTQFTEDEMTLKARKRLLFLIRNVDRTGFLKCTDIDAALVTLAVVPT